MLVKHDDYMSICRPMMTVSLREILNVLTVATTSPRSPSSVVTTVCAGESDRCFIIKISPCNNHGHQSGTTNVLVIDNIDKRTKIQQ